MTGKMGFKCKANQILFGSSQRGLVSNGFELAGFHNFSQEIHSHTPKVVTSCAEGGSLEAKRSGNHEKTQTRLWGVAASRFLSRGFHTPHNVSKCAQNPYRPRATQA